MWKIIEEIFDPYPAQKKVVQLLLERGFQVREDEKIVCGNIEIPHTQIAKEAGVDRRVVDATARKILENDVLRRIFTYINSIAFLRDVAIQLGHGVIEISVKDAKKPGIIGSISTKIAEHGISIRQAVADDPDLIDEPKFTIITNEPISSKVIEELKKIPNVKSLTIY